jgi:PAS domain S-box-containing protein/putative nucleotidyltransferase with HDIG domain
MAQALADKNWQEIAELQVRTNDGRWLWISGMSVQSEYQGKPALLVSLLNITRRKEAEETLRVSEQKYRLLTEKTNDLIWTADLNLHTTYVSPSVERILGLTPEERLKQDATQQMTPESLTRAQEALMKHLALERDPKADPHRMLRVELEYYCKDGSTVWLENQVSGIRDDSGVLIAFHGVARDVSERKKAQEALKASEIKYKDLFEHTLLGMEVLDGETGKVVLSNRSLARTFGFKSPADMVGINPMDYVLPEDLEWVATQMAELMTDPGWNKVATVRSRTEDGRIIWVTAMTTPFDYEGRPSMLLSLVEATAAKEAQDRLQESELKNRLLIENAAEGIIVVQDGVTRFSNRKCAEITGWSPEELNSKPFLELVHPEDREMIAENYIKRVAGEDAPNNYQFRIIDKQGNTKWLQVNAVQLNWEGKVASLSMLSDVTERVKAEQALRDSEERFRALIEEATDAVAVLDVSGRVLYHSPSLERVTGYALEDWLGKSLGDWSISPEDLASMAANLEVLLKEPGKALEAIKVRYMRKDGSWHTLEATARNMLHDPKIGGIVANFRDITERVKSEEALKESEERYRLFADNVSDVIWVTDMNLKPVYISPSVARMLGYTGDQAMTGAVDTRLTPASAQMALRAYADAMAKEAEHPGSEWDTPPLDLEMVRGDGSTVWMATKFSFIRAADGKPFAILGVLRDVTERKKAEDSLRKSEERFRGLVETTSDWVWELDQNTRYTYVSPKVRDILGYEPRELLGRTPYEFMHQRESRRVARIVRRFATARLPFSLMENTCTHKDGHSVVLETSAVPILDKDGGFLGYRGIDRDITERKKVEQELQRSLKRLEKTMASTIEAITTTIETRDPYTTGHQMRVTDLACAIARVMELTPNQIEGIRVAGLLHDIGKIAIPTEILSKPGRLNDVEYEMIKTHAKVGYNILKKIEFPWPVARSVLQHHERWNGSGYPHGIAGEDILLDARILAVADVMEAMASHRPYRPSVGLDKALDEITKNSGILYDPAVANACATAFTHGFKFAPALPAGESGGPSSDHPVHSLGDR